MPLLLIVWAAQHDVATSVLVGLAVGVWVRLLAWADSRATLTGTQHRWEDDRG